MMHRTTVFIPRELHVRLRNLGWKTRTSLSLLLELAAREALADLLKDPPDPEALRVWEARLRSERFQRDQRFAWLRRERGTGTGE